MLNYVWVVMLLTGFIIGALSGRLDEVTQAALSSAAGAVELSLGLLGIMCLWSGIMNIASKSGLIRVIAKVSKPLFRVLFPQIAKNDNALSAIVMNIAANFLGLGNAATPLGIKAMRQMQMANPHPDTATDAMCMFMVLNTAAIQLIPTTIIALRSKYGATTPSDITVCVWVASVFSTIVGILLVIIFSKQKGEKSLKSMENRKRLTSRSGLL